MQQMVAIERAGPRSTAAAEYCIRPGQAAFWYSWNYLRQGVTGRDDTGCMRRFHPEFNPTKPRW